MKRLLLLGALSALGCQRKNAPEIHSGLRVPLPDGWHANPTSGGIAVGPSTRAVLQLEPNGRPLPTLAALVSAIEREKAVLLLREAGAGYVGVTYRLPTGDAFLGAKQFPGRTIWCATNGTASNDEVALARTVCANVTSEAP